MIKPVERRQQILEILSFRRYETISNLMMEFHVSRNTIIRDIDILSCSAPIYTVRGNGGGIRIADGYYVTRVYLSNEQEKAIIDVINGYAPNVQILQSILNVFSKPKIK